MDRPSASATLPMVDEGDHDDDGMLPVDPAERARRERLVRTGIDAAVVAICTVFVFASLHPRHLLSSAVPAGGDMGAHVWGPAYLRDHLLPDWRVSGWTPDWYAGFPAYQFYMVVPSLLIVVLDVGLFGGWTMIIPLLASGAILLRARRVTEGWPRRGLIAVACVVGLFGVELPYGTAFKLVTILGLLTLPVAAYTFGRLADLSFPGPALLAVATVPFLFDRNFTIYGGNVASTLAGEFAFSISLSLCVVYLGVVVRGVRTGRHRALAAVLLAFTGLCHLIPAFYALAGTVVIVALSRPTVRTLRWLGTVMPVAAMISSFWVLPFFWQRDYVNDMGWEKIPYLSAANDFGSLRQTLFTFDWSGETYWKYLVPRRPDMVQDLRWVLAFALIGLVLSLAFRVRLGAILAGFVLLSAVAFVVAPQGRLWNARLLPFYYLSLYLLAAIGVAEVARTVAALTSPDPERPSIVVPSIGAVGALLISLVLVGLPLRSLPLGAHRADGSYSFLGFESSPADASFVSSWARWNFTGYVGKDSYAEYRDLVRTMERVGRDHGCGRSMWEYEKELNRYGTPMALMLLPHWTDGCIGSMEGLFFEASATTPFHFLNQVELSAAPSAAQRDLPYDGFNIDDGVSHLQLMGVRYYLSTSVQATTAARAHPDLTEIATSGPWVIFEVADSDLVESLANEPAVLDGVDDAQGEWICGAKDDNGRCAGPAVAWFNDRSRQQVMLASSGPASWPRVDPDDPEPRVRPSARALVSDVSSGTDRIAFDVDRPGTPVLVKASYFPNWRATGAEGPYRVAPNLMVVVPTAEHVELTYGREPVEWVGYALTILGIGCALLLARRSPVPE
ncbi:MAG: 6-pyruvoyl-tetrahydropterin synthase-related protein [Microthrixaceae bacterium]